MKAPDSGWAASVPARGLAQTLAGQADMSKKAARSEAICEYRRRLRERSARSNRLSYVVGVRRAASVSARKSAQTLAGQANMGKKVVRSAVKRKVKAMNRSEEKTYSRIYICHTYYHVYIACLKELNLPKAGKAGEAVRGCASLMLSSLSNDFGNLKERAEKSGLFEEVIPYEEKPESYFPQLASYHKDKGNIVLNMLSRMKYTKLMGRLQAPFVSVDLKKYKDIYVFCDSDPIGYYLNTHKIYYHALEDGLDCIRYYDTARYDNRGHFGLKAWMAGKNLIFIQNGYAKYCLDMEVNDISVLEYPCPKYREKPRKELTQHLGEEEKETLVSIFIENRGQLYEILTKEAENPHKVLVLSEPLCDLETRKRIFSDIIEEYGMIEGEKARILIKPHPRDVLDYRELFPEHIVLDGKFPMEILNYVKGLVFDRVVTVFTVPSAILFAKEKVFLGEDFMDKYEAPEIHRQNEQI